MQMFLACCQKYDVKNNVFCHKNIFPTPGDEQIMTVVAILHKSTMNVTKYKKDSNSIKIQEI